MKNILVASVLILLIGISCKTNPKKEIVTDTNNSTLYDSTLATRWGADDYGMKSYVLVLLKRGPNRSQDSVNASGTSSCSYG
jgi:hypothetical protein